MARISFAGIAQTFNMSSQFAALPGGGAIDRMGGLFGWVSREWHGIALGGSDFTFDGGGSPTGGTVATLRFDLGNNNPAAPDLGIAGLGFDLTELAPLVGGGLSSEAQNDLLWRTVLADDDAVEFGAAASAGGFSIRFFGDGRNVTDGATLFGGDDTMTGDIGGSADPLLAAQVSGDVNIVSAGSVFGGDDRIAVTGTAGGSSVFGDAVAVYGFLAGGSDVLSVATGGSLAAIYGDAGLVGEGGIVSGGNDTINLSPSRTGAIAVGDAGDVVGRLSGGGDVLTGSAGNDFLYGDAITVSASGILKGGADTISGGAGDDTIWGDWKTASGQAKGGNDKLYGGTGNDTLFGNGGNDLLDGGAGADAMFGGAGNDTYVVDAATDIVDESVAGSSGVDGVQSANLTLDLSLAARFKGAVENATLLGARVLSLSGNGLANALTGNSGANTLDGRAGADVLTGGLGNDAFRFTASLGGANVDRISDFSNLTGNDDTIQIDDAVFSGGGLAANRALSGGAFQASADGVAADLDDRIIYNTATGQLFWDVDGAKAGGAAAILFAVLENKAALSSADFFVV